MNRRAEENARRVRIETEPVRDERIQHHGNRRQRRDGDNGHDRVALMV